MKHHLTETHERNFEIHNIVLSSQSISLSRTCDESDVICNTSVCVYATGHINLLPLIEKSRALCPGGRFDAEFHSSNNPHHRTE